MIQAASPFGLMDHVTGQRFVGVPAGHTREILPELILGVGAGERVGGRIVRALHIAGMARVAAAIELVRRLEHQHRHAFVVVVIGGLGSFWGVVLAALLVGVVRGVTIHFMPAAGEASMYVLMFLVLLLRPRGLLGERIEKFEA